MLFYGKNVIIFMFGVCVQMFMFYMGIEIIYGFVYGEFGCLLDYFYGEKKRSNND